MRVAAIQMPCGKSLKENLSKAREMAELAFKKKAKLLLFPEYFSYPMFKTLEEKEEVCIKTKDFLKNLSKELQMVVAGNCVENFYNTCFLFSNGRLLGAQKKVHPLISERKIGIKPYHEFEVFESEFGRIGILICADVLYPEACRILGLLGVDVVLNPVASPFKKNDLTKDARDCVFVSRAFDNSYFLIKSGGFGSSSLGTRIVGRSLIAAPWGILAKYEKEFEEEIVMADLDLELLKILRKENYSLRERNVKAYKILLRGGYGSI
ncbi:MAG: carbon-nitrogen hydrolase family protein [Candidatus Methanofastidiosia archaeon]